MLFNSFSYFLFLTLMFCGYWLLRRRSWQNLLLLAGSYAFYGWVHPWFCILVALSTVTDWSCALQMERWPERKRVFLGISLATNLGMLGFFKYFNFFADNFEAVLGALGFQAGHWTLRIFLPAGISFYTFQTLSYVIDVYRGQLRARSSLAEFALFVTFFPQLIAGPIERAEHLLRQVERERSWNSRVLLSGIPFLISGYLRKMVVADNVSPYVDRIFLLQHPSLAFLALGAVGFAVQIYADFSGYTDIAIGSARLLGFDLRQNFDSPYMAISPSDFWRRWHISFSTWIRDYLYIPLGGSRVAGRWRYLRVLLVTMGLSGLWHGAAWNFVAWGLYHGLLLWLYHEAGLGGRWSPSSRASWLLAWGGMFTFTMFGWLLFRAPRLTWLVEALVGPGLLGLREEVPALAATGLLILFCAAPLLLWRAARECLPGSPWYRGAAAGLALVLLIVFGRVGSIEFIYFQF